MRCNGVDMVDCTLWESSIRRVLSFVCAKKERKRKTQRDVCASTVAAAAVGSYW